MTQYLLSVMFDEAAPLPSEDEMEKIYQDVDVVNQKMMADGAWVFGGGLHPIDTATVVSVKNGETLVTDGPYIQAKEQIGGFWIINAPDLDAALEWATQASAACQGPVEVRPFQDEPEV
jgi:hypothetical protein